MPRVPTMAEEPRDMTVKGVPAETYNALVRLAEANHRPLRGEVLAALEQYVASHKKRTARGDGDVGR